MLPRSQGWVGSASSSIPRVPHSVCGSPKFRWIARRRRSPSGGKLRHNSGAMLKAAVGLLFLSLFLNVSAGAAVKIEKPSYKGWPNCYRITNGEVELLVSSCIGPRIMRYGFVGDQNFFKEFTESLGKTGEPAWVLRGGHRVWAAPEDAVRTYAPDNGPIHIKIPGAVLEATEPVEPLTGLEKQIVVKMSPQGTGVEVLHRIRNAGAQPLDLAVWALTMMTQG